ncbi:MAG TPA: hypothetical protein VF662_12760 [Allosphingosinicella sp.]|jgi:hypothetical protein
MVLDQPSSQDPDVAEEGDINDPRQRSTIGFPYADLADVEQLVQAIHSQVGGGECDDSQLAPWLGLSPKSSGFRVRVSAARLFGVIESHDGNHRLTDLGKMIVDPLRQRTARVHAFLNVPLFEKIYEQHKGGVLPPAAALERAIEAAGVAPKQKSRARQVLERSAEQAAFFEQGRNRLVKPGITDAQGPQEETKSRPNDNGGNSNGGDEPLLDKMLLGLIDRLPRNTSKWAVEERIAWLSAATVIFQLVYGIEPEVQISTKGTKVTISGSSD